MENVCSKLQNHLEAVHAGITKHQKKDITFLGMKCLRKSYKNISDVYIIITLTKQLASN